MYRWTRSLVRRWMLFRAHESFEDGKLAMQVQSLARDAAFLSDAVKALLVHAMVLNAWNQLLEEELRRRGHVKIIGCSTGSSAPSYALEGSDGWGSKAPEEGLVLSSERSPAAETPVRVDSGTDVKQAPAMAVESHRGSSSQVRAMQAPLPSPPPPPPPPPPPAFLSREGVPIQVPPPPPPPPPIAVQVPSKTSRDVNAPYTASSVEKEILDSLRSLQGLVYRCFTAIQNSTPPAVHTSSSIAPAPAPTGSGTQAGREPRRQAQEMLDARAMLLKELVEKVAARSTAAE